MKKILLSFLGAFLLMAGIVRADLALPVLFPTFSSLYLGVAVFIVIVLLEAAVAQYLLKRAGIELGFLKSFAAFLIINIVSTLVGYFFQAFAFYSTAIQDIPVLFVFTLIVEFFLVYAFLRKRVGTAQRALLIAVAVNIVSYLLLAGLMFSGVADPLYRPPRTSPWLPEHRVTDVAREQLLYTMEEGGLRTAIAAPQLTSWSPGTSGAFFLGVKNEYNESKLFYLDFKADTEGLDPTHWTQSAWSGVSKGGIHVMSGELKTTDYPILRVPEGTVPGIYQFRIDVCEDFECNTLYGTETFVIEVVGLQ